MNEEFNLPDKWYIVVNNDNLNFYKSLKNRELKHSENYEYFIGGYYSSLNNCPGMTDQSTVIKEGWKEITIDQFKKYVLKFEEEVINEDYSYLVKLLNKLGIK